MTVTDEIKSGTGILEKPHYNLPKAVVHEHVEHHVDHISSFSDTTFKLEILGNIM